MHRYLNLQPIFVRRTQMKEREELLPSPVIKRLKLYQVSLLGACEKASLACDLRLLHGGFFLATCRLSRIEEASVHRAVFRNSVEPTKEAIKNQANEPHLHRLASSKIPRTPVAACSLAF